MTQRVVCVLFALAVVFGAVNFAAAEEAVPSDGKAVVTVDGGCPCGAPVVYRHGLFGHYAYPAVVAPAPIPAVVAVPPCSGPVTYRLGFFGRYYHPVYPRPVYPRYIAF